MENKIRNKNYLIFLSLILFLVLLISFVLPKSSQNNYQANLISKEKLENLRLSANVECLQNSQCSEEFECISNECVNKEEINKCKTVNLYTPTRKIKTGDSINSIKEVLTGKQLPYLLSDGEFVEVINNKPIEYFYSPAILIGDNRLEKEIGVYSIKNDNPLYTYKLMFSKGVDFSNKNIQGQILKILGEEYIIDAGSSNSNIKLVSDKKIINLQDSDNIKITKDDEGNIIMIGIKFNSQNSISVNDNFSDSTFNAIKLSFKHADDNFVDVRIGGAC